MARFINITVFIDRFRREKIYLSQELSKKIELEEEEEQKKLTKLNKVDKMTEINQLKVELQTVKN
jgi:hypothetical protein